MTEQWHYVTETWSSNDDTSRFTYWRTNWPSKPRFLFIMAVTWIGSIVIHIYVPLPRWTLRHRIRSKPTPFAVEVRHMMIFRAPNRHSASNNLTKPTCHHDNVKFRYVRHAAVFRCEVEIASLVTVVNVNRQSSYLCHSIELWLNYISADVEW